MEKACTAQAKHSLSKHWQFATKFAGRESKPLFPFTEGECCSKAAVCVWMSIRGCAKPSLLVPTWDKGQTLTLHWISTWPCLLSLGFSKAQGSRRVQGPGSLHPCLAYSRSSPSLSPPSFPEVLGPCPAHPRWCWMDTVLAPALSIYRETQPPWNSGTKESTGTEVFNQSHCCSCSKSKLIKTFLKLPLESHCIWLLPASAMFFPPLNAYLRISSYCRSPGTHKEWVAL